MSRFLKVVEGEAAPTITVSDLCDELADILEEKLPLVPIHESGRASLSIWLSALRPKTKVR